MVNLFDHVDHDGLYDVWNDEPEEMICGECRETCVPPPRPYPSPTPGFFIFRRLPHLKITKLALAYNNFIQPQLQLITSSINQKTKKEISPREVCRTQQKRQFPTASIYVAWS